MRTSAPWQTRLTGVLPPFTAIISCYQCFPSLPITVRVVRSSPTTPSPQSAPTGVVAPPSSPVAARTASKAARGPRTVATPTSRNPAKHSCPSGWSVPQPLHLRRQDLQLWQQLFLVRKLVSGVVLMPSAQDTWSSPRTTQVTFFLGDTGATVSLVPGPASSKGRLLTASNWEAIATDPEVPQSSPEGQPVGPTPVQL